MKRYSFWHYIFIGFLILVGILYALPNFYGETPALQISANDAGNITQQTTTKITDALKKSGISYESVEPNQEESLLVRFATSDEQMKAQNVLQATLGSGYTVALNLAAQTPAWLLSIGAKPMRLGLDLRGGIHFLLQVDMKSAVSARLESDISSVNQSLQKASLPYQGVSQVGQSLHVQFATMADLNKGMSALKSQLTDHEFEVRTIDDKPVLVVTLSKQSVLDLETYAINQNITIMRNRVNELGVGEPVIQRQGAQYISVDLPGVQDSALAKEMLGKVATVQLYIVDSEGDAEEAAQTGVAPFGMKLAYEENGTPYLLKNQVVLHGSSIVSATSGLDENGQPNVSLRVGGSEVSSFNRITGKNIHKPMAVVYVETKTDKKMVDGKVSVTTKKVEHIINVATIQNALGNSFQIMGLESMRYAQNLALQLRSGAYSAPVFFVQEQTVGPSLGQKNIKKGVLSIELGALVVIIFMALYYRVFGLVANCALLLNIVFIVAILSILGATLTLPGIAGIVLTVGMAVDANVLIDERIREELRLGMSPQASINMGYERAFSTIVDANVTTLIVAVVLFALGSGSVQGFAVTLIIGLLTSMVTAIYFTRVLITLIYGRRSVSSISIGISVPKKHADQPR